MLVTQITFSGGQYLLAVSPAFTSETPIDWPDYVGGTVKIGYGGNWVTIDAASPGSFTVATLDIPYYNLRDDDQIQNGQDVPDPDVSGLAPIWAAAYIMPRFHPSWNTPNAGFHLNTRISGEWYQHGTSHRQKPKSANSAWCVLVKNGYQSDAKVNGWLGDMDPWQDDTWRACAGSEMVIICEESLRDWIANPTNAPSVGGGGGVDPDVRGDNGRQTRRQEVLNHEIGHLFLQWSDDHDCGDPANAQRENGDVMVVSPTRKASVFGAASLHDIRRADGPIHD